jgi:hypothetical protein
MPLDGAAFATWSNATASCQSYFWENAGCTGNAYLLPVASALVPTGSVIDDTIRYPGATADHAVQSSGSGPASCWNLGGAVTATVTEVKAAPLSSLGFSGAFHLDR